MGDTLNSTNEIESLTKVITEFQKLDESAKKKLLNAIIAFFDLKPDIGLSNQKELSTSPFENSRPTSLSEDRTMSPKEFMLYKNPQTDVERVVCLAYYLTHYKDQRFFKNIDLSLLNTEAAQMKFSNIAKSIENATYRSNLLVQGVKGQKQISALGELYVQALPDREAAKNELLRTRSKRKSKKTSINSTENENK